MQAIILAGGKGTRLRPFTNIIPKPLVPIGDQPILGIVLKQLKHHGFTEIIMAVNHLAELIMAFFGNGQKLGLNIHYSLEETPLGTAGPLKLINDLDENFLVMNGDLLTTINFAEFFKWHCDHANDATIATFQKEVKIDLGVLKTEQGNFIDYIEKPTYSFDVSMGIYAFNRSVLDHIPAGHKYDMPDLIKTLKKGGLKIECFKGGYDWLDIGRMDDYEQAIEVFNLKKSAYIPE